MATAPWVRAFSHAFQGHRGESNTAHASYLHVTPGLGASRFVVAPQSPARAFLARFVQWYNHDHRHTGLGLHTPAEVHYELTAAKASDREAVLATARSAHPERFTSSKRGAGRGGDGC